MNNTDADKGPGMDGIPPLLLKNCSTALAPPITLLFNRSLLDMVFPTAWKSACIIPIYKSGNCNRVTNYRGISILCCLSKVFEKMIHNAVYNAVSSLLTTNQHGFMKHRSTTTNLMCFVNFLSREMERRRQVDAVYVDFAKAFDTVPHILVIDKLKRLGFPEWFTKWLLSYLSNRTGYVVVNSARSQTIDIASGVPQGSVLGPLIFNIFVNDLGMLFSSFNLSFADDLKIFRVIATSADCITLQEDINALLVWCSDNGMRVNGDKCKIISFTRCTRLIDHQYRMQSVTLERKSSICDLGVTIDAKLTFNEHVAVTTVKAFSALGFIRRHASSFNDVYALKTLYCSMVRSILEYAAPVWTPYYTTQIFAIERVQKKFIRFALRQLPWNDPENLPPYPERCRLINLDCLSARRIKMQRLFVFDVITGNIDCPALLDAIPFNIPPRRFRSSPMFAIPYHRTNYGHNNPLDSCLRVFNEIDDKFDFNVSKEVFKNRICN